MHAPVCEDQKCGVLYVAGIDSGSTLDSIPCGHKQTLDFENVLSSRYQYWYFASTCTRFFIPHGPDFCLCHIGDWALSVFRLSAIRFYLHPRALKIATVAYTSIHLDQLASDNNPTGTAAKDNKAKQKQKQKQKQTRK